MNYHYSQVQEAEYLEANYLDGKQLGMSNSTITVKELSGSELKMESSTMPQYSAISEHSTVKGTPDDIRDWLILLLEDSHVKISLLQGTGGGIESERSGLWKEMLRTIGTVRPYFSFVENSSALTIRGLGTVLGDLSELGYSCRWCTLGASDIGAPHQRKRMWLLASDTTQIRRFRATNEVKSKTFESFKVWGSNLFSSVLASEKSQYQVKSEDERMGDGLAFGMERFSAIGNGQVPIVAATAWEILSEGLV